MGHCAVAVQLQRQCNKSLEPGSPIAFPKHRLEVCFGGRGWEHLGLEGQSTFNSIFFAVEQLLKEGIRTMC